MKKAVTLLAAVILSAGMGGCLAAKYSYEANKDQALAVYDGRLKVPGLQGEADVYRDSYGVPHIFADNDHDLFFAIGYVQAQDRLFEMMLLRAVAEGRSAELLGRVKVPGASFKGFPVDTIMIDQQQRAMGMRYVGEIGEAVLRQRRPDIYNQLQAYSDGINHFIDTHQRWAELPIEFQILRVKPARWRPADSISFGRLMGFILGYNMMVELWRYGLIEKYGEDVGWEITGIHNAYGPTIVPLEYLTTKLDLPRDLPPGGRPSDAELGFKPPLSGESALDMLVAFDSIRRGVSLDLPFASNNWALAPKMTATGTAMLENDTHLFHMEPSIWYMSHVKGAGFDSYGAMFPGTPFHALGHTRSLAWAATTSIADVQDLFIETVDAAHPGQYLYKGEWRPFTIRHEKIKVRGERDIDLEVRQSIHGPILSDYLPLPAGTPPTALRWVAWDFSRNPKIFDELIQSRDADEFMARTSVVPESDFQLTNITISVTMLMQGKSVDDFIKAMNFVDLPNQNWVAADAAGNIAYLPGGLIPVRKKGVGALPVPGASGEFDWQGFIPLMELPHLINPERGWIVSANNEVVKAQWYPYVFDLNYDGGWRAWRIEELIGKLAPIDMADMKRIQNDVYVKKAEVEVPMILAAVEKKGADDPRVMKGYELLKSWDYEAGVDSIATGVFFNYVEQMRKNVLADEVTPDDFELFLSESQADIVIESLEKKGSSPLFDDQRTPEVVEDLADIMVRSLRDSVAFMEKSYGQDPAGWRWGKIHVIKFYHPLGFGPLADLSVGPFEMPGSRHTIRCASPSESGRWHFKDMNGPAWRHIIDLGDPDHALAVIDGSISGQWLSPHYEDLHPVWVAGDHLTAVMDPDQIKEQARYHLVLMP
ncbi:MAG TPA: penicillin acylase family protein [bacterium]|nr:penicillin acylase family protein [bacterium]